MSGSPLYYSPEIVQKEDYDEKVDVWGIGTITF
jgi:serine/threonine protein kinase